MVRRIFITTSLLLLGALALLALRWPGVLWGLLLVGPAAGIGLYDMLQRRHSLLRNYPLVGHGRYLLERFRPEIQQYFVETNTDGMPYAREFRSVIYQRSKATRDTMPFGTQRDVDRTGYEWMCHSVAAQRPEEQETRVRVGGERCKQPYMASHLNISAMSFGALSRSAILALNTGARLGGFAHNTGEGGLSDHHLGPGGDLVWQIGTACFGCRDREGRFDPALFQERSQLPQVKMIEIKLSQGAKPGHGGILPAAKLTPEIAAIRGVPLGRDVVSPPSHTSFSTPLGLLEFVARLGELSGGKPVGFKLCVGHRVEFLGICKAMIASGILPDFITVDGAEGGTGAAPVELSNSVGMPMRDGLLFVHSALRGAGLRDRIRVIASGKISTGFHMIRAMALGADLCNAARAMMFALGCIQSRRCDTNGCPVGIATQDPALWRALDVEDKARRVASYHQRTIRAFLELLAANGRARCETISPEHVLRRVDATTIRSFAEVYEYLPAGCLLDGTAPERWLARWERASPDAFL